MRSASIQRDRDAAFALVRAAGVRHRAREGAARVDALDHRPVVRRRMDGPRRRVARLEVVEHGRRALRRRARVDLLEDDRGRFVGELNAGLEGTEGQIALL